MCQFIKIIHNSFLLILVLTFTITCSGEDLRLRPRQDDYYFPRDTGHNNLRCSDYKGHRSGKSRWPFKCLLPASHLATGRVVDGTSSLPERFIAPPWINLTLFEEGQRFARDNSGHLFISSIYGAVCAHLFLDQVELLLFTRNFESAESSSRTNLRITNDIFNWYRNTPPATDYPSFEMVAEAIMNARRAHRNVSSAAENFRQERQRLSLITPAAYKRRSVNSGLWDAFMIDVGNSPIPYENRRFPAEYKLTNDQRRPLNQFIEAITQFGFVGLPVLYPERVGLTEATDEELFAFNHLWAVIAYCIGIRDEYNISLQPDIHTTRKYFQDIFETFIQPAFFQVDFFTKILVDSLLEGANLLHVTMTPSVIMTRVLRDVLRIPAPQTIGRLNSVERLGLVATDALLRSNGKINQRLVRIIGEDILRTAEYYEDIVGDAFLKANTSIAKLVSYDGLGWDSEEFNGNHL